MKGFIRINQAPVEKDNVTYFVNINSISHFHSIDTSAIERARNLINIDSTRDHSDLPKTIVYLNTKDSDDKNLIFRIAAPIEKFIEQIENAMK